MTREEVAGLLARLTSVDSRNLSDLSLESWFQLLEEVPADVAWRAAEEHFRTSDDRLMPVHLHRFWRAEREHAAAEHYMGSQQGKCPFKDCRCTHTDPCDHGWVENGDGTVRPCPTCRPEQAKVVSEAPDEPGPGRLAGLRERSRFATKGG